MTRAGPCCCATRPRGTPTRPRPAPNLAAADGDLDALPPKSVFCPMIYAPVTAHARGEWKGRPVDYSRTFSNACSLAARTGHVFALDS